MKTLIETIKELNTSAKKAFGEDIAINVARCPAFGNTDTCLLVYGKNHIQAAKGFAVIEKNAVLTVEKQTKFEDSDPDEFYSVVTF